MLLIGLRMPMTTWRWAAGRGGMAAPWLVLSFRTTLRSGRVAAGRRTTLFFLLLFSVVRFALLLGLGHGGLDPLRRSLIRLVLVYSGGVPLMVMSHPQKFKMSHQVLPSRLSGVNEIGQLSSTVRIVYRQVQRTKISNKPFLA